MWCRSSRPSARLGDDPVSERGPNPFLAGVRGRCPRCGEGALFDGYLKVASRCDACGLDLTRADSGDGPAVFVMFLVGFIVVPVAFVLYALNVPHWLNLTITLPMVVALTLALLPPFKATLIALQFHHRAEEARLDDG